MEGGPCEGAKLTPWLWIGGTKEVGTFGNGGNPVGHRRFAAIEGRVAQRPCRAKMMTFYFVHPSTAISAPDKETSGAVWDGKALSYMGRWIEDYVSALKTAGYEPSQVTKIILNHKHSDHSGEIRSFPNAKFYVNRVELETDEVKALKDHPGITPVDFTDGPYYNFTRSQIIAPGVRMLPAPGHTYGNSIIIAEDDGLFYMFHGDISYTDEAMYADKLSIVYDDIHLTRSTQNTIREFIRNHPTVYCGTHTPLGYENLESKRVMDLDNPPQTIWPTEDYFVLDEGTGKYICSICGYVYDPAEHDGVAFEDLPDDWKCPRCKQSKEKFNKA